jgi:hypothetical protein
MNKDKGLYKKIMDLNLAHVKIVIQNFTASCLLFFYPFNIITRFGVDADKFAFIYK